MILLQVLSLAAALLAGVATNWWKIPPLLLYSIVVGAVVVAMPAHWEARLQRFSRRLVKDEGLLLLTMGLIVFAVGAIYAYYQTGHNMGENYSFPLSSLVAEEGIPRLLAAYGQDWWLTQHHPPLMIIFRGLVMRAFGTHLLISRFVTLVFAVLTILVTYSLGRELYGRETGFTAMLFLLSFPLFLRLGTLESSDVPLILFFSLALLLILRLRRLPSPGLALLAGGVITIGLLVKYMIVLVFPVLLGYYVVSPSLRKHKRYLVIVPAMTVVIGVAWLVMAHSIGILGTQAETLLSFVSMVIRKDYGRRLLLEAVTTRLPSALGAYNFPIMVLGAWFLLRRRSQSDLLVMIWIVIVFLLVMITLPDHRYFTPAFPAIAVMMASGLARVPAARPQAVILSLLYCVSALYLLVDWQRASFLFMR